MNRLKLFGVAVVMAMALATPVGASSVMDECSDAQAYINWATPAWMDALNDASMFYGYLQTMGPGGGPMEPGQLNYDTFTQAYNLAESNSFYYAGQISDAYDVLHGPQCM